MKLPLGALLVFLGYAVLWTGYMNVRVTFKANPGGDPTPQGGAASGHLYTLWEAITCQTPSLQPKPQPGDSGSNPAPNPGGLPPPAPPPKAPGGGPGPVITPPAGNPLTGCPVRQGDIKLVGGMYWRPFKQNTFFTDGQLIGPC